MTSPMLNFERVGEAKLVIAEDIGFTVGEQLLAKRVAETLMSHYPGHAWAVDVGHGIINIRSLDLHGEWGYTLHNREYSASELEKRVVRAGGEVLERFGQARGRVNHEAIAARQRNWLGDLIHDA